MADAYKKSKGNAGMEGVQFQLDLLIVSLLNALYSQKHWKISSENQQAGKYDDLVLELPHRSFLLQAKFKQTKKITRDQLFSCNSKNADFSLPKYFLSYLDIKSKFGKETVIICTNTSIDEKGLEKVLSRHDAQSDSMLYYEGTTCSFFTFNKNVLADLKASAEVYLDKNLQGKGIDKASITDENIKSFLKNLQFFSNYPSGDESHRIIDKLLRRFDSLHLCYKTSYHEIFRKVEDWFKQPKGEYLTETRAKAMLCEIKSDKYCVFLRDYNVSFQRNDFIFTDSKRIFHVISEEGYLMQMLKIFRTLQSDKRGKLYINPDENVELQKNIIEAFELRRYSYLIMVCPKIREETMMWEISSKLREILENYRYKKVILIAETNNVLVQQIGLEGIFQIDGSVTIEDLSRDTQESLLKNKNVVFQGNTTTLEELLETQETNECTKSLHSEMLEKLVRGEEIKVGVRLLDLDEDTARYYVPRTFERKEKWTERKAFPEEIIFDVKENVTVIADGAGMGKSTVLTKMAVDIKKKYPFLWIIRINLNDYTRILRDCRKNNIKTISLTELLNSKEVTKMTNQFEKFVFSIKKKVVLMLDGVDEISPDYTDLILDLLGRCYAAPNFAKIFVTTRPHLNKKIKMFLNIRSFQILPYSRENQLEFLRNYWVNNLQLEGIKKEKCERYAEALIDKMSAWIKSYGYWESNFTAIPLQLRIIAEIFQASNQWEEATDWRGCKEYISGEETEPKLPEKFNIVKLYDMIIEKKRDVFIDKGSPSGSATANPALVNQFEICLTYHYSLALKLILGRPRSDLFTSCHPKNTDTEEYLLKIGIVQRLGDEFQFVHRTFGEYFVAKCIVQELKLQNPEIEFQKFLIDEIFQNENYLIVRDFLDFLLQEVSLHPDIFKKYRSFSYKTSFSKNLITSLAEEGYVEILRLILKSINFKIIRGKEIEIRNWPFRIMFKKRNTLNDLKVFVQKAGINIKDENGGTPLHSAVNGGHLKMVKFLVEHGVNVNIQNNDGYTALHDAQYVGYDMIKYLTEHGADINIKNNIGNTVLHLAANRNYNTVKYLVRYGADVNSRNSEGFTSLHLAAKGNLLNIVKYLLEHGADVKVKDGKGRTALHLAATENYFSIVKCILEGGADINDKDSTGCTALILASTGNYFKTVKYLQESDQVVTIALHLAANRYYNTIIKYLIEQGADVNVKDVEGRTALYFTAQIGDLNTVKNLVEHGADVNVIDNGGCTALHLAAKRSHLNIVKYLLEHGADVKVKDGEGRTALHFAAAENNFITVKYLLEFGADINEKDGMGCTALLLVIRRNSFNTGNTAQHLATGSYYSTIKYLVEHGEDVDVADSEARSALYFAAQFSELDTVKYLVEQYADVNIANSEGSTALHFIIKMGDLDIAKYFVEHGADVNFADSEGRTALYFAVHFGKLDTVKYLVEHGADVNVADNEGHTALYFAAQLGKLDIVKYLMEHGADINFGDDG